MDHVYCTSADCTTRDCGGTCYTCCLDICKVCGLYEGSLTTECPGVESYEDHADKVYAGRIDFRGGKWVKGSTRYMAHKYPDPTKPRQIHTPGGAMYLQVETPIPACLEIIQQIRVDTGNTVA